MKKGVKSVAYYHGGMADEDRMLIQQQYLNDQLEIICCTSAFGMGVNKSNIRYVIHLSPPLQIEAYLQEIGRAGRDGEQSSAFLLYSPEDYYLADKIHYEFPNAEQIESIIQYLFNCRTIEETEIIRLTGISETTWRFLRYHFEELEIINGNCINIKADISAEVKRLEALIQARIDYRMKKFEQFRSWILQENTCRRELLLKQFDEKLKRRVEKCCDVCGIDLFQSKNNSKKLQARTFSFLWEEELKKLFQQ